MPAATHPYLDHPGPIPFAHRGGTEVAPENSVAAFAAAVALGFRHVETDVHLSADGVVVAAHDARLDRVAGHGGAIEQMTWSELQEVRIGGTEVIPTLEELLATFPDTCFNVDAKSDAVVPALVELVRRLDVVDRLCVGSFSDERLRTVRHQLGHGACTTAGPRETASFVASARSGHHARRSRSAPRPFSCLQLPVRQARVELVTPRVLQAAHREGVQVHVWTIDDPVEMHRLLDLGVDGIMTDRPSVLRSVLRVRGDWHGDRSG